MYAEDPAILLAGCTSSNGLSNVYLLSLHYNDINTIGRANPAQVSTTIQQAVLNVSRAGNHSRLEVRAGYMGLCVTQGGDDHICSSSAKALASILKTEKTNNEVGNASLGNATLEYTPDPLNLILIASDFREKIVFDGLL